MMKRLRIPLLTAGGVVLCAFVLIPMAFDTLDIGPEIVEVSKSMLHMPSPTPTAEVAENFAITAAAPKDAAEAPSKYRLLKLGDTDPVVADIHERLAELQYMDGDEPSEYFGEPIEAALKRFQRIHHMKETGEADELTQEMLFSDKAAMYKLQQGDEGEDVESLQERLQDLGYEVEKTNGYFGVATVKALSSFQKKNKLDATGVMDTDTADILYSNNARPKVDPTPSPTPKPKSTPTAKPAKTPKISATPKVGNESIGTTKTADPQDGRRRQCFRCHRQCGRIYCHGHGAAGKALYHGGRGSGQLRLQRSRILLPFKQRRKGGPYERQELCRD